jgi:hypothetical protein
MEHIICREQPDGTMVSSLVVHSLREQRERTTTHNRTACCTAQPYLLTDQATAYGPYVDTYKGTPGSLVESRDQPEPSGLSL